LHSGYCDLDDWCCPYPDGSDDPVVIAGHFVVPVGMLAGKDTLFAVESPSVGASNVVHFSNKLPSNWPERDGGDRSGTDRVGWDLWEALKFILGGGGGDTGTEEPGDGSGSGSGDGSGGSGDGSSGGDGSGGDGNTGGGNNNAPDGNTGGGNNDPPHGNPGGGVGTDTGGFDDWGGYSDSDLGNDSNNVNNVGDDDDDENNDGDGDSEDIDDAESDDGANDGANEVIDDDPVPMGGVDGANDGSGGENIGGAVDVADGTDGGGGSGTSGQGAAGGTASQAGLTDADNDVPLSEVPLSEAPLVSGLSTGADGANYFDLDGSGTPLVLVFDIPFDEFDGLYVNGELWTPGVDYTARAGSTIITISAERLTQLGEGTYTLAAVFSGTPVEVVFTLNSTSGTAGASEAPGLQAVPPVAIAPFTPPVSPTAPVFAAEAAALDTVSGFIIALIVVGGVALICVGAFGWLKLRRFKVKS